jgi:GH25 family lysozyme M1 (1,4-beta-N-acetylmuramidase)
MLQANVSSWLGTVRQATGRRPIIYVSPGYWNAHMRGFDTTDITLWVAHWGVPAPSIPKGWNEWTFWQHSDKGTILGIAGAVDLDYFNGTLAELRTFIEQSNVGQGGALM